MGDLSIIIVNWNTAHFLKRCLESLKKHINFPATVYVVDNASEDDTREILYKDFRWVHLISNKENKGFGRANNQALRKINSKYVLLLNPDTELQEGTLEKLFLHLEGNLKVAAVSPVLISKDNKKQSGYFLKFPSLMQILLFYTEMENFAKNSRFLINKFFEEDISGGVVKEVDQLPGACILIKTEALKEVSLFDERYPLFFEDVDLSYKLRKRGYRLLLDPSAKIHHFGGGSFKKMENNKLICRFYKSMFIFYDIHRSFMARLLVRLFIFGSFIFLLLQKSIRYLIKPTEGKKEFIQNKWRILQCMLA